MIAVTIGIGDTYSHLARLAAKSCRERTGLETFVLDEAAMLRHQITVPHQLKFKLFAEFPQAESIFYFDADTIFLRDFCPQDLSSSHKFVAVRDKTSLAVVSDARRLGLQPSEYFNSGVFIIPSACQAMLKLAEDLGLAATKPFFEQTALNAARARLGLSVHWLSEIYNFVRFEEAAKCPDIVIGHFRWIDKKPFDTINKYYQYWSFKPKTETPRLAAAAKRLTEMRWEYQRSGMVARFMRFGLDGKITVGRDKCEKKWRLTEEDDEVLLWLSGEYQPTCALIEDAQAVWTGKWLHHEQTAVKLTPKPAPVKRSTSPVEVVLMNWRRPENTRRILEAFDAQRRYCRITLIESAADSLYALTADVRAMADQTIVFNHNFGPVVRYIPTLAFAAPYAYFHDDDMLPGSRVLEYLLECAKRQGKFAALGQFGRILSSSGQYAALDICQYDDEFKPVDILVRASFLCTADLCHIQTLVHDWKLQIDSCEDDLLLCIALQIKTGRSCMLTPKCTDPSTRISIKNLAAPFALSARKDHLTKRKAFLRMAMAKGWRPLRCATSTDQNGAVS